MTKSHKVTFAAVAAIAAALSLAVAPTATQVFAQPDCPGCGGQGHTETCLNVNSGKEKEGECPGNSQTSPSKFKVTKAGNSDVEKGREQ
jgi:hypothetical protein